jgi:hypothetical protein
MKSGNYNELLDKFYAGTATAEEINLLQLEGLINEQDILYADTLREERAQKMDWEFEDFMNDIPSEKVVAFPAWRVWMKRILPAAAMIAAIVAIYIFWPQTETNKMANVPASNKTVNSNKELIASAVLPANKIKDSSQVAENIKTTPEKNKDRDVNTDKKRPVQKSIISSDKTDVHNNSNFQDYLVVVNGKPVTNEADAAAITRESLGMVSRNLALTVNELKPISRIKLKL